MYLRFPEIDLPDGRSMRIEMMTQMWHPSYADPDTSPLVRYDVDFNPFLVEGIPAPTEELAPSAGMMGGDSMDFSFLNIPIHSGLSQTLFDVMQQVSIDYVWHIRFYVREAAGSYSNRPEFWGIVDRSEPSGEQLWFDDDRSMVIGFSARNRMTIAEKISVQTWIDEHLLHATYDLNPTGGVYIDGTAMNKYAHDDGGMSRQWRSPSTLRFFRIVDIVQSISNAMGFDAPINGGATASMRTSWGFRRGGFTLTTHTLDDVCVVSRTELAAPGGPIYQHEWGFFDDRSFSQASVFKLANVGEALKMFLVPFGLTASIEYAIDGTPFMHVREVHRNAGMNVLRAIEGVTYEPSEGSRFGLRVVTADHGEYMITASDDESIDNPFMTASRLRTRSVWDQYDRQVDDIVCLYHSLFIWDAAQSKAHSVRDVIVSADGEGSIELNLEADWVTQRQPVFAGNQMARALSAYYFNPSEDENDASSSAPIGIYRTARIGMTYSEQLVVLDIEGTTTGGPHLVSTGAFPLAADMYLHRLVMNMDTGQTARITAKVSDSSLQLSDGTVFPSTGIPFVIFAPRAGHYKMVNGVRWRIHSLAKDFTQVRTEYKLERGVYV